MENLIETFTQNNLDGFRWLVEPICYSVRNNALYITPQGHSDFFYSTVEPWDRFNAAALVRKVKGNFVAIANVEPNFSARANAAGIFGFINMNHWSKLGFERTSPKTPPPIGPITMVTNFYRSDDATGETLRNNPKTLWLKYVRNNDSFAMFYSENGENYTYLRKYAVPDAPDLIEVGLFAQNPDIDPVEHKINYFSIKSVKKVNVRTGLEE
ncbi:MAG: DUF1349 domain-containing protein [Clostridiales bacterium]|nr:DUF1349 domain-containing protein [Clostridiales bacterium]